MEKLIRDNFVPIRIPVRENPGAMERFNAQWTPTILLLGPDGKEHQRVEGFLEVDDFLAQLTLGLAKIAFANKEWDRAAKWYDEVLDRYPSTDAAPEAQYWRGVTRYKATNDPAALAETTKAFQERYSGSTWATKASVWG